MKLRDLVWLGAGVALIILTTFTLPQIVAAATSILPVFGGGTGSSTLTGILIGNGTSSVQTLSIGTGLSLSGTTLSASGSGITQLGPLGQLQNGATQTLASTTSSFNGLTDGLTITASGNTQTFQPSLSGTLNNAGLTYSALTVNTTAPLSGGGSISLGSAGTLSLNIGGGLEVNGTSLVAQLATSSIPSLGQLLEVTGNGTPTTVEGVSTSSISVSPGLTVSGTLGSQVGGTNVTIKQVQNRSFTISNITAPVGTTTLPIEVGFGETWNTAACSVQPNGAALNVDFYWNTNSGANHLDFFVASSTLGTITFTTNNVITAGATTSVAIGSSTAATANATSINCTVNDVI